MDFTEFCNQVIDRTDLVKLVSRYCTLKRSGSRYFACCPFHGERTPSLSISPETKLFYCFGCHKGGNAITFLRDIENIDSIDAIKLLAEEAGLEMPELSGSKAPKKVDKDHQARLYALLKDAAKHYNENLKSASAVEANKYIKKRNIPDNIITRFGIGYSIDRFEMVNYLQKKGYSYKEMKDAGLADKKLSANEKEYYYDVFHERLMFPIIDQFNQVVGFGGRVLVKTDMAKYRNTSGTQLFDKSKIIYGLNFLKKKKREGNPIKFIIMCEGYMDVIALHKAGFDTAVASMGTALTPQQARMLKNYCENVVISYDGDSAGQKATLRGLDILSSYGLNVKVAALPEGKDPDEVINEFGPDGYKKCLAESLTLTEFKLKNIKKDYDLSDKDGRAKYAKAAVECISKLEDPVAMEEYLKVVAVETGYEMSVLRSQAGMNVKEDKPAEVKEELSELKPEEAFLLSSFIKGKEYVNAADMALIKKTDFTSAVIDSVTESRMKGLKDVSALLYSELSEEMSKKIAALLEKDFAEKENAEYYGICVYALMLDELKKEIKKATEMYNKAKSEEEKSECLAEIAALNKKMKELKTNGGFKNR
ncbi:MAG: DNA primase [Clostridia bacterium]|nr:DNA primase [Clostridia bacterium]